MSRAANEKVIEFAGATQITDAKLVLCDFVPDLVRPSFLRLFD